MWHFTYLAIPFTNAVSQKHFRFVGLAIATYHTVALTIQYRAWLLPYSAVAYIASEEASAS